MRLANRHENEHVTLTLLGGHVIDVTIGRDKDNAVRELFFVGRGKTGHQLDRLLEELGVKLSRALQDRNPETGEELFPEAPA